MSKTPYEKLTDCLERMFFSVALDNENPGEVRWCYFYTAANSHSLTAVFDPPIKISDTSKDLDIAANQIYNKCCRVSDAFTGDDQPWATLKTTDLY